MNNLICRYTVQELLPVVSFLSEKFTGRESTSVTYERANQLMGAVIYCINKNPDAQTFKSAQSAYTKGYKLLVEKVKSTKALFEQIQEEFISFGNRAYYETVTKGMPAFFIKYDPRFNPLNKVLTLDYPTIIPVHNLEGVDAIHQYLLYISLEQDFLKAFAGSDIERVLAGYHPQYEDLFINLAQIIYRNVIGCLIADKNILDLQLDSGDLEEIKKFLKDKTKSELVNNIHVLTEVMVKKSFENNRDLLEYLWADGNDFCAEIINARENNCLESIFYICNN